MVWNVDPVLFSIGPIQIRYYGILFAIGIAIAYGLTKRQVQKWGDSPTLVDDFLIWAVIGVIGGARIAHVVFYDLDSYLQHPWEIPMIWHGGLASHGGAVGLILAVYFYMRKRGRRFYDLADPIAIFAPLTTSCVRLGNLMNSEIVGRVTDVPWAFQFVRYDREWRHPTQIYEALMGFIAFGVLFLISRKKGRWVPGAYFWILFAMYFSMRFLVEFTKEYEGIPSSSPVTMGQILSIPLIVIAVGWLVKNRKRLAAKSDSRR